MASQAKLSRIAINNILLATDFSPESQNAFQCAVSLAKHYVSTLFLTHVLSTESSMVAGEAGPAFTDVVRRNAEESMARLESAEGLQFLSHEVIIRCGD